MWSNDYEILDLDECDATSSVGLLESGRGRSIPCLRAATGTTLSLILYAAFGSSAKDSRPAGER